MIKYETGNAKVIKRGHRLGQAFMSEGVIYRDETGREHDITQLAAACNLVHVVRCRGCRWHNTVDCACPNLPEYGYCSDGMCEDVNGDDNSAV